MEERRRTPRRSSDTRTSNGAPARKYDVKEVYKVEIQSHGSEKKKFREAEIEISEARYKVVATVIEIAKNIFHLENRMNAPIFQYTDSWPWNNTETRGNYKDALTQLLLEYEQQGLKERVFNKADRLGEARSYANRYIRSLSETFPEIKIKEGEFPNIEGRGKALNAWIPYGDEAIYINTWVSLSPQLQHASKYCARKSIDL